MSRIRIGSPILCGDGREVGEVDRVIVDPKSGELTHLVVRATHLLTHDVVLPISAVRDRGADAVTVTLGVLDLERLPDYVEEEYVSPAREETPPGAYGHGEALFPVLHGRQTPHDLLVGKEVDCRDGLCGTVDELLLHPISRQVLSFRLRRAGALSRDVVVPAEWVLDARGERVRLDCSVRQLEDLLPPAPALEQAAE